jgi:uncharacterized protein (DUF427 family)
MLKKLFGRGNDENGAIYEAVWNGAIIAQSGDIIRVEGNAYFPRQAVGDVHLEESTTTSICPWKGRANYFNIVVDGQVNTDAAWHYPNPSVAAKKIKDRVAFWKGVKIRRKKSG